MAKSDNLTVFRFGDNLNMMFSVVSSMGKMKLNKKVLVLKDKLNLSTNDKYDVFEVKSIDLNNFDFNQYSVVVIESDMNNNIYDIAHNIKFNEVVFIAATNTDQNVNENLYNYIDFSELAKLNMFKKIAKVNEIKNKLSGNKAFKKFKFF